MKFTALEEYGLRCILHLARRDLSERETATSGTPRADPLTLGEIAEKEGLTREYTGKIFRILARAGLVESERGRKGGYRLTRPPESVTVSETLDALGGRIFDGEICGRYRGDKSSCVHTTDCAIRSLWKELQSMIDAVLLRMTLSDLVTSESRMHERMKTAGELAPGSPGAAPTAHTPPGHMGRDPLVTIGVLPRVS